MIQDAGHLTKRVARKARWSKAEIYPPLEDPAESGATCNQ